jgi:DNA polymerase-3 subunit beta
MNISCTQENLQQGLSVVSHIANKNTNLPILSNILIKVENKEIVFSTTNLEIGVKAIIRGKIEQEGELCVDAKLLTDYIQLLPKERVDLTTSDDILHIVCNKQKTKVKTQISTDFPLLPTLKKESPYFLNGKIFKEVISKIVFAVANLETRPEISGILLSFEGKNLMLVGTDGYRLAEYVLPLIESNNKDQKIIIPVKTLQEISRILSVFKDDVNLENQENIEIYINEGQILFSYNNIELISRVIDGQYPEYKEIIPQSFTTTIVSNINNLIKTIKTASLFTKSGIFDIQLEFSKDAQEIIINSSSNQIGENQSTIPAQITGESIIITLNYRYLLDGLQNCVGDEVEISLIDSNSPCIIKPVSDNKYLYLIMPIKQ